MIGKASSNAEAQHAAAPGRRKVALALQGGGSHGAFTWGVLDRLLDDETIEIIGVTGTSAGAMNGAVLVDGLVRGGPKQARTQLRRYWEAVGSMPGFGSYFSNMSGEQAVTTPLENVPACVEAVKKNSSPYDLPSANDNPTRRLLSELIDFDRLRSQQDIQLTVSATNARTARRRVFTNQDVSVDALLASACLPQFFCAVEIDGEPYWDGSLTGNPAFGPLLTKRPNCDLLSSELIRSIVRKRRAACATSLAERLKSKIIRRSGWSSARLRLCCVSLMRRGRRLDAHDFTLLKLARSWKNFRCRANLTTTRPYWSTCSI